MKHEVTNTVAAVEPRYKPGDVLEGTSSGTLYLVMENSHLVVVSPGHRYGTVYKSTTQSVIEGTDYRPYYGAITITQSA